MSDSATPPPSSPHAAPPKPVAQEIKIIAHSSLFYWWPVWFFGFLFAAWTYVDNYRLAIVSADSQIREEVQPDGRKVYKIWVEGNSERLLSDSVRARHDAPTELVPGPRVSPRPWMGPVYLLVLFLVIIITNVPLRGLWSLVAIISIILVAVLMTLFDKWDVVLQKSGDLHIYMNMAGYLALSTGVFIAWVAAVWVFDRRTYIVFTPGQIKVCEEIGGREKVFDTTNLSLEKHRDDWFRHIILGFGTGDLTVKTAGADRHEIVLPNVAFIGFKIDAIEQMLRTKQTEQTRV
jgi:hypothetical protein